MFLFMKIDQWMSDWVIIILLFIFVKVDLWNDQVVKLWSNYRIKGSIIIQITTYKFL